MLIRRLAILIAACTFAVVATYVIFVGVIGENEYTSSPAQWVNFSSYLNNIMSPLLAFIAAMAAINSISESRKQANSNSEINNCLHHIEIVRGIIEKRWNSITDIGGIDWERKASQEILHIHFPSPFREQSAILSETLNLGLSLQSLSQAVQWYAHLHKNQISITKESHPTNEWANFPTSLLEDQSKKMKFCYAFLEWRNSQGTIPKRYANEALIYMAFYEGLINSTTLREE